MTERQQNRKLLGEKLSQLPVAANEPLWNRIAAQLPPAQPVAAQPDNALQQAGIARKAVLVKTIVTVVTVSILAFFIGWQVYKTHRSDKKAPVRRKPQIQVVDTAKAYLPATRLNPVQQKQNNHLPVVAPPARQQVAEPAVPDNRTPLKRMHMPVYMGVKDSLQDTSPALTQLPFDSIRLRTLPPPAAKEEGYYFETKKKKGKPDSTGH